MHNDAVGVPPSINQTPQCSDTLYHSSTDRVPIVIRVHLISYNIYTFKHWRLECAATAAAAADVVWGKGRRGNTTTQPTNSQIPQIAQKKKARAWLHTANYHGVIFYECAGSSLFLRYNNMCSKSYSFLRVHIRPPLHCCHGGGGRLRYRGRRMMGIGATAGPDSGRCIASLLQEQHKTRRQIPTADHFPGDKCSVRICAVM